MFIISYRWKTMYTWSILIAEKVLQALLPTHPRYYIDLNISLHISFGIEINKTYFMLGPISMFSLHDLFTDSSRHPWQQVWWHVHEQSPCLVHPLNPTNGSPLWWNCVSYYLSSRPAESFSFWPATTLWRCLPLLEDTAVEDASVLWLSNME